MSSISALSTAIENSKGIIVFSLDTRYCYTSFTLSHQLTMKKIWGVDIKLGDNILDFLPSPDYEKAKANFDRALQGEHFTKVEEYGDKNLMRSFWEDRYDPIIDENGKITGLVVFVLDVSNLVRTSKQLEETQERLHLALESGKTGAWEWNIETNEVFWSDKVYDIFHVNKNTFPLNFDSSLQLIHEEDRKKVTDVIQRTVRSKSDYAIEYRILLPDGTTRWLSAFGKVHSNAQGEPYKLLGIIQDVTNQKKEHIQNTTLALVSNTTTNMVVIADGLGRIEWVNPAFTRITGYELSEAVGKKPGHLLQGPLSDPEVVQQMRRLLSEGKGFKDIEIINYTKSGTPYWISIEMQPIRNNDGKIIQMVAVESDITERKKNEAALRESEIRFRQIVQSSPMGLLMYELQPDDNLILIEANQAANNILRINTQKLIGLSIDQAFPSLAQTDIPGHYRNAAKYGIPWSNEDVIYQDNQIEGAYQVHAFQAGQNRVAVFFLDITEKKKTEKLKQDWEIRYNLITKSSGQLIYENHIDSDRVVWSGNTLEILGFPTEAMSSMKHWQELLHPDDKEAVLQELEYAKSSLAKFDIIYRLKNSAGVFRTMSDRGFFISHSGSEKDVRMLGVVEDITHEKEAELNLIKKNEELIKTNHELDSFVYSASHDLRAPIASLLGLIKIARLEKSIDNIENLLKLQEKSLLKLDNFIRDIVDHSQNARLKLEFDHIDIRKQLDNSFEQFHFLEKVNLVKKDITIDQSATFTTDPRRLQMILNNLISNALKYADFTKVNPFIKISVTVSKEKASIIISDNGEGIHPDVKDKIFDMFYRASERSTGSGLGLYIVKEALRILGGSIDVQSTYGWGSTFSVTIPNHNSLTTFRQFASLDASYKKENQHNN